MRRTVLYSLMALALLLGLTLSMATPVMAEGVGGGKSAVWESEDGHPVGVYLIGQTVYYELHIDNKDDTLFAQVDSVQDRFGVDAVGGLRPGTSTYWWNDGLLDPDWVQADPEISFSIGADSSWTVDFSHVINEDHLIDHPVIAGARAVVNQILATGSILSDIPDDFNVDQTYIVRVIQPEIELEKTVEPVGAQVGETVTYTFTITNTGDWPLANIVLIDALLELSYDVPGVLGPGEEYVVDPPISYTIQSDDPMPLINEATVTGTAQGFDPDVFAAAVVSFSATAEVEIDIPVGGTVYPMNALIIVLPGLALAVVIAGIVVYVRSRRGRS